MDHAAWWIAMWVAMLVFWAFVGIGVFAMINALRRHDLPASSEEILKRRLAAGDITREEYDHILRGLRGDNHAPAHH
ncbi:MAG TPA: hypothetical protein VFC53_04405 [Dehalococcoidia bacterium]|nr:hypothetical protein [Dehalococcoidia bacterium]